MNTKLNTAEADAFTEMPLVTVYMPTHNRVELLQRAVESVLTQTYKNIELIIVDDKSTDSTPEYLEAVSKKDPRVRFFRNEENSGACVSRNKAIFAAKGEFVTGLDDDDYFHSKRVEILLNNYSDKHPVVCSNSFVLSNGKVKKNSFRGRIIALPLLLNRNAIGNQVFTRRDYLLSVGGYDENLLASQDLDLWIRIVEKYGPAKRLKDCLYYLDISHELSRISIGEKRIKGTYQFLEKYSKKLKRSQKRYIMDSIGRKPSLSKLEKLFRFFYAYNFPIVFETILIRLRIG